MRLLAAVIASALLTVLAGPLQQPWLAFVFKPLTTILILLHAWPRGADEPLVRRWLLAGLGLSLLGDVALLWPQQGFLPGLIAFLLTHLSYIVAFSRRARFAARWQPFALYAAVSLAILSQLWPGLPTALRGPVIAYVLCLATMAAQAAVAWWVARGSEHESQRRSVVRCSSLPMRCWPPTSSSLRCRRPRCGFSPPTGRRSGALRRL